MISAVQPDVIRKLLKELQLIEPAVAEHGKRVQLISLCLALHIEHLSADDLYTLSIAAVFHDIGKLFIKIEPYRIYNEEARWEVRRHTSLGFLLLKSHGFSTAIADVALFHHEWYDGSGYPFGLKGSEIPLFARICAVADAYEVMITGRPYQAKMKLEDALTELKRHSGRQFDPAIVDILLKNPPDLI